MVYTQWLSNGEYRTSIMFEMSIIQWLCAKEEKTKLKFPIVTVHSSSILELFTLRTHTSCEDRMEELYTHTMYITHTIIVAK